MKILTHVIYSYGDLGFHLNQPPPPPGGGMGLPYISANLRAVHMLKASMNDKGAKRKTNVWIVNYVQIIGIDRQVRRPEN